LGLHSSVAPMPMLAYAGSDDTKVPSENIYKRDLERKFERLLLGSAQVNLIPPEMLREIR
jgi:hypothetical protein